jgi:hypothetical protein
LGASATGPGTSQLPLQFPADLISAATADPIARSDAQPSQLVSAPRATLAALAGLSASNPIIQSLARSGRRRHSNDGIHLVAGGATRDLIGDEFKGGHTIETHVGKSQEDLADRLDRDPELRATSTYRNLPEAAEITQQVIDLNRDQINAWIANPMAAKRLVVSVSRPITRACSG